ncbi:MAG: hypothetical protein V2I31_02550, partial [Mariniphaga sp.]|nr:hypothetical protein [Mariniphaga sp.]
ADFAVIRPYTARSVRGIDHFTADRFLTDNLLETAVFDFNLKYDTFEPFDCSEIQSEELNKYPFVVAELGIISEKTLQPFLDCKKPCLLILAGAESEIRAITPQIPGVPKIVFEEPWQTGNSKFVLINAAIQIELEDNANILFFKNNQPAAWEKENRIVILQLPEKNPTDFAKEVLNRLVSK